jgi:FkbM family methyltransferase
VWSRWAANAKSLGERLRSARRARRRTRRDARRRERQRREAEFDRRVRALCRELPKRVSRPFFVKVGAHDGVTADPCSDALLENRAWRGLLIEPVPYCFERLRRSYADERRFRLEPVAIGVRSGSAPFYYADEKAREQLPDLPAWYDQLGSFDRDHLLRHLPGIAPFVVEREVEVRTLPEVLERNGVREVHLLHVDAEGQDLAILRTLDFRRWKPLALLVEHALLSEAERGELDALLADAGYAVEDSGRDYLATLPGADSETTRVRHSE